jgi:hypothetical protein
MIFDVDMEGPFCKRDQFRVLPLRTRPLLAGRSFFGLGVTGRFAPRMSSAWATRKRSLFVAGELGLAGLRHFAPLHASHSRHVVTLSGFFIAKA